MACIKRQDTGEDRPNRGVALTILWFKLEYLPRVPVEELIGHNHCL